MFDRLEQTEARYEDLTQALALPETMNDSAKFQKTAKAHSEIARELGCSIGNSKSQLHQARVRLRRFLRRPLGIRHNPSAMQYEYSVQ